jgi:hypothetical protein
VPAPRASPQPAGPRYHCLSGSSLRTCPVCVAVTVACLLQAEVSISLKSTPPDPPKRESPACQVRISPTGPTVFVTKYSGPPPPPIFFHVKMSLLVNKNLLTFIDTVGNTGMCRITTFRSTTDRIYGAGPIIL